MVFQYMKAHSGTPESDKYCTYIARTHPSLNLALPPSGLRPLFHHDHLPLRQSELLLARRVVRRDHLRQLHLLPRLLLLLFLLLQRVRPSSSSSSCCRGRSGRRSNGVGGGGGGLLSDRSDGGGRLLEGDLGVIRDGLSSRWLGGGGGGSDVSSGSGRLY